MRLALAVVYPAEFTGCGGFRPEVVVFGHHQSRPAALRAKASAPEGLLLTLGDCPLSGLRPLPTSSATKNQLASSRVVGLLERLLNGVATSTAGV